MHFLGLSGMPRRVPGKQFFILMYFHKFRRKTDVLTKSRISLIPVEIQRIGLFPRTFFDPRYAINLALSITGDLEVHLAWLSILCVYNFYIPSRGRRSPITTKAKLSTSCGLCVKLNYCD